MVQASAACRRFWRQVDLHNLYATSLFFPAEYSTLDCQPSFERQSGWMSPSGTHTHTEGSRHGGKLPVALRSVVMVVSCAPEAVISR
jgi:hypothetical protein